MIILDFIQYTNDNKPVYPVYILKRVVDQLVEYCKEEVPIEALGVLIGWHYCLSELNSQIRYTKITDWVTGEVDASHIGAKFTEKGITEYNMLLDEKYGSEREGPYNVGLFHSHPFGVEPHFSNTDYSTFLVFPYNNENNVFILIDPVPETPFFKVFQLQIIKNKLELVQIPWIEYSPISKDFEGYKQIKTDEIIGEVPVETNLEKDQSQNIGNNLSEKEDPIFNPPNVEDIKDIESKKKKYSLKDYF